ncbi:MAG: GTPase HflX [Spirochaetes bacterium]|nr:GTPase HflX [Spirochaetota bacterium]
MDASVNRIPISENEKAILIGIQLPHNDELEVLHSIDELSQLVVTAGAVVVTKQIVKRASLDPAYIIGSGKLDEIKKIITEQSIKLVVFDLNTIRPVQIRNLENLLGCRVIGRTEVILDIFARRAKTVESKIQVELAQLNYILPRLKGLGGVLSRLGGGIGTRGPGEKMLETDRRHIVKRIQTLKKKLSHISRHRNVQRQERLQNEIIGAVVGYTNAGKSTLVNVLAKDDLFVEDRLFATLDAYTRIVYLDESHKILLTDTVGFINNLPSHLVESFKSTLEEIKYSDFIIHVVGLDSDIDKVVRVVNHELQVLNSNNKPIVLYFNKLDIAKEETINYVKLQFPDAVVGSSLTGEGIQLLKEKIIEIIEKIDKKKQIFLEYSKDVV